MDNNEVKAKTLMGFGSRIGYILTTLGFCVGIGTFWRFPYLCGVYGGSAFFIVYVLSLVIIGIPLLVSQTSIGYAAQKPVR